jgi:hypothetical protein
MGGAIDIAGGEERGATFIVSLPASDAVNGSGDLHE